MARASATDCCDASSSKKLAPLAKLETESWNKITVIYVCLCLFQVDGVDLRDASHEQAVEAIRKAGNPVVFLVQSIINRPRVSKHHCSVEVVPQCRIHSSSTNITQFTVFHALNS